MPTVFKYKAAKPDGTFVNGELSAEREEQIIIYLKEKNFLPISIKAQKKKQPVKLLTFLKGSKYEDLIMFTNSLATLYRAGVPLLRSLSIIKVGPPNSRFNYAIESLAVSLQEGKVLSQAMEEFDDIFSTTYRASVAAGEESGKLDDILDELSDMLEQEMILNRELMSGIRYPVIVVLAISAAFIILTGYVIPKFISFYGAFGADLPLPTRIIIETSNFVTNYWWVVLSLMGLAGYTFYRVITDERGKLWFDKLLLGLPIFGELIAKSNVARFSLMFRIMFKSGITIIKTLEVLADSVKNSAISAEIREMEDLLRRGKDAELLTHNFKYFPRLAIEMMSIGMESGSMEKMLHVLGKHFAKQVQYTSRHLTAILEPILTIILSVFILIMALAIMMPMWNLIKVFNR